jgi:hypothetical protein
VLAILAFIFVDEREGGTGDLFGLGGVEAFGDALH